MADHQTDQNDDVFSFFAPPYESTFSAATPSTLFSRSAYSSSSSSGDEDSSQPSVDDSNKRIDYMIQFLDRILSEDGTNFDGIGDGNADSLPEFVGKCGESGIFKVPIRSAVHPNRPPSLEIRPHPLSETQIGRFLRTMTSTERQLWAGGEDGAVRVWKFSEFEENLKTDDFMRKRMNGEGFVHIQFIAGFNKLKALTCNIQLIVDALQGSYHVELKGYENKESTYVEKILNASSFACSLLPEPS